MSGLVLELEAGLRSHFFEPRSKGIRLRWPGISGGLAGLLWGAGHEQSQRKCGERRIAGRGHESGLHSSRRIWNSGFQSQLFWKGRARQAPRGPGSAAVYRSSGDNWRSRMSSAGLAGSSLRMTVTAWLASAAFPCSMSICARRIWADTRVGSRLQAVR